MKIQLNSEWFEDCFAGFTAYYLTSLPVLLGVWFGWTFLRLPGTVDSGLIHAFFYFDGTHYMRIHREGYSYDPAAQSSVAFFPAYPLLGRGVRQVMQVTEEEAQLLTSHLALLGAFILLARYVRLRWPEASAAQRGVVLAVFGLWPLGLFFRMPYAESLFVCGTLAVLYGMARGWSLLVLALLAGFVTATRPPGVAVTAAFVWYVLTRPGLSLGAKAGRIFFLAPLACWGLLAYMGYQWLALDTPWAFAQTQEHWNVLAPKDHSWPAKLRSLAMLEPIWGVYVPGYPRSWENLQLVFYNRPLKGELLSNIFFWNPIFFLLAIALLVLGACKRWLTGSELVLGACLLAIPYLTRAYEMSMGSHARFAAVVVVNYLVIGRLLARAGTLSIATLCSALTLWLFLLTALYVTGSPIF